MKGCQPIKRLKDKKKKKKKKKKKEERKSDSAGKDALYNIVQYCIRVCCANATTCLNETCSEHRIGKLCAMSILFIMTLNKRILYGNCPSNLL